MEQSTRGPLWIGLLLAVFAHSLIVVTVDMVPRASDMFIAWFAWYLMLAIFPLVVTLVAGFIVSFRKGARHFGTGLIIGALAAPALWVAGAAIQAAAWRQ